MERPLYAASVKPRIAEIAIEAGNADIDAAALYSQVVVDKARLVWHIRHVLQDRSQVTLRELCDIQPLQQGLAELVAYLQLAGDPFSAVVDEQVTETIVWHSQKENDGQLTRQASLPRVIFVR
jgi:hypothetical protein